MVQPNEMHTSDSDFLSIRATGVFTAEHRETLQGAGAQQISHTPSIEGDKITVHAEAEILGKIKKVIENREDLFKQ